MSEIKFYSEKITKTYPKAKSNFLLDDINVSLKSGQITGVVGENGNGKTTLLRIIAGELSHSGGQIHYPSIVKQFDDWRIPKEKIAYIPQRIPRWFGLLKDNLHFKATSHGILGRENETRVEQLLTTLGLEQYANHTWSEISTGYRLRFELARMMIGEPELLVLDEPIANLDINAQQKFLVDLKEFVSNSNNGLSVILSSQQLHEIENFSDSIIFLKQGKCLYSGAVNQFDVERTENNFELQTDITLQELKKILMSDLMKEITLLGNKFIVKTDREIDSTWILQSLVQSNVKVLYFRDISQSTKKLFDA
jgi:ABC-2 type transport system ATP-binding protein